MTTTNASVILTELEIEPCTRDPNQLYIIRGRGILTPGVTIPNAWWDRHRLLSNLTVAQPKPTAHGTLEVGFSGHCGLVAATKLTALANIKEQRELLEREIVPELLLALGMIPGPHQNAKPLPPFEHKKDIRQLLSDSAIKEVLDEIDYSVGIGQAVDYEEPPEPVKPAKVKTAYGFIMEQVKLDPIFGTANTWAPPPRPRVEVIHDMIRLAAGQPPSVDREQVFEEAEKHGLLSSGQFDALLAEIPPAPAAIEPSQPTVTKRRDRVRIIDI